MSRDPVAQALRQVQYAVRDDKTEPVRRAFGRVVPNDLEGPEGTWLNLGRKATHLFKKAVSIVVVDERFEHLDKEADNVVWRFACRAALDRSSDHVPSFIAEHAQAPRTMECHFPVEGLRATQERTLPHGVLRPLDAPEVPTEQGWFSLAPPVGSVLAVPATGTHPRRMAERAGVVADHQLRVLRLAMREHRGVGEIQLRFRRSMSYSFGGAMTGWKRPADSGVDVELGDEVLDLARSTKIFDIPVESPSKIERNARIALRWLERGVLATDPLEGTLFFFFGLEALLAKKSDKKKAAVLAFRRAMLSTAIDGHFSSPERTHNLYVTVRSAAVHGSVARDVSEQAAEEFGWDVRRVLVEYLQFAEAHGFVKPSQLLQALDEHPDRTELMANLKEFWGGAWLDELPD